MKPTIKNKTAIFFFAAALLLAAAAPSAAWAAGALTPEKLRCEHRENPRGIDVLKPRLTWIVRSNERAQVQTAYRILVAGSREALDRDEGDAWDSGKVESSETALIEYAGAPLASQRPYFWKALVWDGAGEPSEWSEPASWSMGLLDPAEWKAKWIGYDLPLSRKQKFQLDTKISLGGSYGDKVYLPSPYLRKEFSVDKKVRRAVVYASAMGLYELYINGTRVGNDYFTPGWTDYNKRVYYQTYDVTNLLNSGGENAIGGILADGWYAGNVGFKGQRFYGSKLRLLAQLHVEYEDGSELTVPTDETWRVGLGPIREADMQGGESYDARREMPGWSEPGFDAAEWKDVMVTDRMDAAVEAYPGIPVRRTTEFKPVEMTEPQPGAFVFNMGQNFAGVARLKVNGKAGDTVRLRFAEMLNEDGTIYTTNLRSARATDFYTLKGGGEEVWTPSFTFHGFQYVEVTGYPGRPGMNAVTGVALHSDLPVAGTLETSEPMLNKLMSNINWGQRSNYLEVPTDCPQRDERLGWMGDAQAFVGAAAYNMDIAAFFTKWMVDVDDAQHPDGAFADTSPAIADGVASGWADAGIICPYNIYRMYGDKRILEKHYGAMEKWMDYLTARSTRGLAQTVGTYADWLNVESPTGRDLVTNAYYAYDARLMAQIAEALGKTEDVEKYRDLYGKARKAFTSWYIATDASVSGKSQTGYVLALNFGLVPPKLHDRASEHLVENIKDHNWSLTTGFLGSSLLLPTLTEVGRTDVAYRLLLNRNYPSWLYTIDQGGTTIWERWNSYSKETGFNNPGMNSFNHYAFGAVGQWMFSTMAGIDTEGPGFRKILIAPQPGGGLDWVKASYDSIRGHIATHWSVEGDDLKLDAAIPANTTAEIRIPAASAEAVSEGSGPAGEAKGLKFEKMDGKTAVFEAGSGNYSFVSKGAKGVLD